MKTKTKKLVLTIKRPNGEIEKVDVTDKYTILTDRLVERMRVATRDAGRGEILSWSEIDIRDAATRAYDAVMLADAALEGAESASYHDPMRILQAGKDAEKALCDWRESYPEAAQKMDEDAAEKVATREARLADSPASRWMD